MRISTNLRNWGNGSDVDTLTQCAKAAEAAGLGTIWVNERLSTPPDRSWKPSDGGRYLDPILALTFAAAVTERICLGTGVLIVPYRLPFQFVKQVATLQDLSRGRLRLGVGVGWYEKEFEVLGVPFKERGKRTDRTLDLFADAFANDTVVINGIEFPVLPRPAAPPLYVGGSSEAALVRAVEYGRGWIAAGLTPKAIAAPIARLGELAEAAGKPRPEIVAMKTLPLDDVNAAIELASAYRNAGVAELVHADGYPDARAYRRRLDILGARVIPALQGWAGFS